MLLAYEDVTLVTIQARSLNLDQVDQVRRVELACRDCALQNEANPLADTLGAIGGNMGALCVVLVMCLNTCIQACGRVSVIYVCSSTATCVCARAGLSVISLVEAAEMFALLVITSCLCTRDRKRRHDIVRVNRFVSLSRVYMCVGGKRTHPTTRRRRSLCSKWARNKFLKILWCVQVRGSVHVCACACFTTSVWACVAIASTSAWWAADGSARNDTCART
jgi:hypothetical protein